MRIKIVDDNFFEIVCIVLSRVLCKNIESTK